MSDGEPKKPTDGVFVPKGRFVATFYNEAGEVVMVADADEVTEEEMAQAKANQPKVGKD